MFPIQKIEGHKVILLRMLMSILCNTNVSQIIVSYIHECNHNRKVYTITLLPRNNIRIFN